MRPLTPSLRMQTMQKETPIGNWLWEEKEIYGIYSSAEYKLHPKIIQSLEITEILLLKEYVKQNKYLLKRWPEVLGNYWIQF